MKNKPPTKPSQFTESYQFIQSLFQEPISTRSRVKTYLYRMIKTVLLVLSTISIILTLYFFLFYDISAITVIDGVLSVPRRGN